ncbi:hypothetical protein NYZ99_11385 [Maribacter litopenaei]|uniref:Tetratricopeptide repeat protein n=1 Tax=Maribacter litopenaei TaxID=2976127 RepID=A0ABY5Y5X1_9FLAO|nr:hypothetical protein [Maribacter litopenaei]UWX53747.1 hypothetical protein NYZ99_11385 [Maribacter litopenaei]
MTNLADYYGHAGRIEDSYDHYLKALEVDANNAYAKKGIAWIVFSHDKNPKEALRILDSITENHKAPDYFLLKAEIADYMGNDLIRLENIHTYFTEIENPSYGQMYNAYNLDVLINETEQFEKALQLAKEEVSNRPTPESYSWLAYSYLKLGNPEKAKEIIDTYVIDQTYEPSLLYVAATVYKANDMAERINELKQELLGALYELGPGMESEIRGL